MVKTKAGSLARSLEKISYFYLEIIQVLHQHILAFLDPPPYISIISTANHQKLPFLTPPTHFFADLILGWSLNRFAESHTFKAFFGPSLALKGHENTVYL